MTLPELSALLWGNAPNQPQDTGWFGCPAGARRRVIRKDAGTTLYFSRIPGKCGVSVVESLHGQRHSEHYEVLATPEAVDVYCDAVAERYLRGERW